MLSVTTTRKYQKYCSHIAHSLAMLKNTNVEFLFIEVWFTDPNNRPLEIKDMVNLTLMIRTG